jgi:hypothetical protein
MLYIEVMDRETLPQDLGTSACPGAVCVAGILFDRGVADRGVHLSMTTNGAAALVLGGADVML